MHKIVLLPLDERPCNFKFPTLLFESTAMHIVVPAHLGSKATPPEWEDVKQFLQTECADAEGLVISLDMLLYGGLLPSRIHELTRETLLQRLSLLREIKEDNPDLIIYAFQCIMSCPVSPIGVKEPSYYEQYGPDIFKLGVARHRIMRGDASAEDEAQALEEKIPKEDLEDYLFRRTLNLQMNVEALNYVEDGFIDFLCVPQEDGAVLGFPALEQAKLRMIIREKSLQSYVMMYPGADEVGLTLLARMRNRLEGKNPAVYVQYAAVEAPLMIPLQEDRPLGETVRYQVVASGCHLTADAEHADFILAVSAPGRNMTNAAVQPRLDPDYDVGRGLTPFFVEICHHMDRGRAVSICDNAYLNGGDLELLDMLDTSERLLDVAGYAGWNTSANTMGTAIAEGVRYLYEGNDQRHRDFLVLRYLEDCGYGSVVRWAVVREDLPRLGLDYYNAGEPNGAAAKCVEQRLQTFVRDYMPSIAKRVKLKGVQLPWGRMYEADLDVVCLTQVHA